MPEPIYVLVYFVIIYINIISIAMFGRMILSWFFMDLDNGLTRFLYVISEPAILPLRLLFKKMNWFQGSPLDLSFTFTWICLSIIELILQSFL